MAEPTNHNDAGEVVPSTVEKQAPCIEEHAPSTDEVVTTEIPLQMHLIQQLRIQR